MKKIAPGFLLPSAAYCINRKQAHRWQWLDKSPEVGDVVYGTVGYLGFHSTLENKQGRIHAVNDGSKALFVFGSRYAPDAFEGFVPAELPKTADTLARSGMIGELACKNSTIKDPTQIEIHGYVCDRTSALYQRALPARDRLADRLARLPDRRSREPLDRSGLRE